MNPLLLFYLLGMFDESEDCANDLGLDLDYTPSGFFVLDVIIFWVLVIFMCWEIAELL